MRKTENLWNTYETINDLIRFADTKATAILAIDGLMAGFYFSNVALIRSILNNNPIVLVPVVVAMISVAISAGFSAFCLMPRLKVKEDNCPLFFRDISNHYSTVTDYRNAFIREAGCEKIDEHLISQIWANSRIASEKYNMTRFSILFFLIAIVSSILFIITFLAL